MADKKGVILIRFPETLADRLRRISFELNIPIKDIVSQIVENNLDTWFAETASGMIGEAGLSVENIRSILSRTSGEDYAAQMSEKLDSINESMGNVKKFLHLVKHGVVPVEAALDALSHEYPNPAGPEEEAPPSSARRKKKAP
jgi:hypothetical protein